MPEILNTILLSIGLGVGLAMDAFTVSLANGLHEPNMKSGRQMGMSGLFAGFQFLMPMAGWVCVHTIVQVFSVFERYIPWMALVLLGFIGGKMVIEGIRARGGGEETEKPAAGIGALLIQGIATSIDALSVGFTIADYTVGKAFLSTLIIGAVTFVICMIGVKLGRKAGMKLAGGATILGGLLLIGIGLEIFITNMIQ